MDFDSQVRNIVDQFDRGLVVPNQGILGTRANQKDRLWQDVELLDSLVLNREFSEFLTLPAYRLFE